MTESPQQPPLTERAKAVRSEMMRDEIIDAALAEFADRGYHKTSMTDIAKRLGVRHSLIYYYFKSKRELLGQVTKYAIDRMLGTFTEMSRATIASLDEFRSFITRLGTALMSTVCEDPRLSQLLILQSSAVDLAMTQQFNEWYDTGRDAFALILQSGIDAGWVRADISVDGVADSITALPFGLLIRHGAQPDQTLLTDRIETFADVLCRAIDPRTSH